jgi:hypothetical protein
VQHPPVAIQDGGFVVNEKDLIGQFGASLQGHIRPPAAMVGKGRIGPIISSA